MLAEEGWTLIKLARITSVIAGAAVLVAGAAGPAVASTKGDEREPQKVNAATSGRPPWSACAAIGQDPQKIIARYTRDFGLPRNGGPALNKGTSTLRCGTTGWGYFHIKKIHRNVSRGGDWQKLANMTEDQGWMDVAHQGITKTLKDPDKITWSRDRETWCLSGKINFYEGDRFITSHFVQTIVGKDTNLVSSYPSDKQCEDNSHD